MGRQFLIKVLVGWAGALVVMTTALTIGTIIWATTIVAVPQTTARAPRENRRPVPEEFVPVAAPSFDVIYEPALPVHRRRPQVRVPQPQALSEQIQSVPRASAKSSIGSPSQAVRGTASWYCKAGVSICHHSYPPGSMVAAACLKLRKAMGSDWRGQKVVVKSGSTSVTVRLVDWCGSTSKLIDLYWEPMRRLGGSGTLPVVVSWR